MSSVSSPPPPSAAALSSTGGSSSKPPAVAVTQIAVRPATSVAALGPPPQRTDVSRPLPLPPPPSTASEAWQSGSAAAPTPSPDSSLSPSPSASLLSAAPAVGVGATRPQHQQIQLNVAVPGQLRPLASPSPSPLSSDADEFEGDVADGSSESGRGEEEEAAGAPEKPQPPAHSSFALLPSPLLWCLAVVGCTFVVAAIMLLWGVASWGVREERVRRFNAAVAQWSDVYATEMARAHFVLLDMRRKADHSDLPPSDAPLSAFANDSLLQPVIVQMPVTPVVTAVTVVDADDPAAVAAAAKANAAAAAASASAHNANGLADVGSDIHTYSPLFYELVLPSPLLFDENGASSDSTDSFDRFWTQLLAHDSRTLTWQSFLDGAQSSRLNLTLPFLKRENAPHLTRHACESTMSGMFDPTSATCSFFSQLHSVCLRVKLISTGNAKLSWSFDPAEVGAADTVIDDPLLPLTSLTVLSPSHAASPSSSNTSTIDPSLLSLSTAGCIWDARGGINGTGGFSVGEYHPVDIRAERYSGSGRVGSSSSGTAGGDGTGTPSGEESNGLRQGEGVDLGSALRVTIKSTHDPYLLAQSITANRMWFGLALNEKLLLAFVLLVVGILFLLAPLGALAAVWTARTVQARRRKRVRNGSYDTVLPLGGVGGDDGADDVEASPSANSPSPSSSPELSISGEEDEEEDDNETTGSSNNGNSRRITLPDDEERSSSNDLASSSTPPRHVHAGEPPLHSPGFVPSAELRASLVSSPAASPSGSVQQQRNTTDESAAARSPDGRKRIRIDPVARYHEPVHQPTSPSRRSTKGVLSLRAVEAMRSMTAAALHERTARDRAYDTEQRSSVRSDMFNAGRSAFGSLLGVLGFGGGAASLTAAAANARVAASQAETSVRRKKQRKEGAQHQARSLSHPSRPTPPPPVHEDSVVVVEMQSFDPRSSSSLDGTAEPPEPAPLSSALHPPSSWPLSSSSPLSSRGDDITPFAKSPELP